MKVLVYDKFEQEHIDSFKTNLGEKYEVIEYKDDIMDSEFDLKSIDFIVAYNKDIESDVLSLMENLKGLIQLGTAKGKVPVEYLDNSGIKYFKTDSPSLISVAEHAFALMLALSKELFYSDKNVRSGLNPLNMERVKSTQFDMAYNWLDLKKFDSMLGKTLGIVGFGTVGKTLAKMASAFGMKVIYTKRTPLSLEEESTYNVKFVEFEELLLNSDFISIHLKLNDETLGKFNLESFKMMKPTAYLINTSRGPIVKEDDLFTALDKGYIAGAGIDVFEYEPLDNNSPLIKLDNVILTAHSAGIQLRKSLFTEFEQCSQFIKNLV